MSLPLSLLLSVIPATGVPTIPLAVWWGGNGVLTKPLAVWWGGKAGIHIIKTIE